ncbi:MAG: POTRA domain-containing protein, partial [Cyanobacteria bacterium P01_H01_bin.150]
MIQTHFKFKYQKFCLIFFSYIHITTSAAFAQSTTPQGIKIPPNAPGKVEETIPQPSPTLPVTPPTQNVPILPSLPRENLPDTTFPSGQSFFVKEIQVKGNSVLNDEIIQLKQVLENKRITFEQLLQLRTEITQLYAKEGYISSGAFIPINQDIANGVVQIQIVEGE